MEKTRLKQIIHLWLTPGVGRRTKYLKKHNIFASMGNNCSIMDRNVPLYANLISIGNNVHIASNVDFITHDITHVMLNNINNTDTQENWGGIFTEKVGCIRIGNNVFIGSNTTILYDVNIGNNVIIGAGSLVNKDIPDNSVVAGVPARVIGSFDEFVSKRIGKNENSIIKPIGQRVSEEASQYYWKKFNEKRASK